MKTLQLPVMVLEEINKDIWPNLQSNGISILENVIIVWDVQDDDRLMNVFINEITPKEKKRLLLIGQTGDQLYTIWNGIPRRLANAKIFLDDYNLRHFAFKTKKSVEYEIT